MDALDNKIDDFALRVDIQAQNIWDLKQRIFAYTANKPVSWIGGGPCSGSGAADLEIILGGRK